MEMNLGCQRKRIFIVPFPEEEKSKETLMLVMGQGTRRVLRAKKSPEDPRVQHFYIKKERLIWLILIGFLLQRGV